MRFAAGLLAFALMTRTAMAHEYSAGPLTIGHPHIVAGAATALSAAGYFSVVNNGTVPDRLLSIGTEAATALLHQSEVDAAGVARMAHLDQGIEIAPGTTLVLEPGEMHVMFVNLAAPFAVGEKLDAVLMFEQAGPVSVSFIVELPNDADAEAHQQSATPLP